jgi:transposase
VVELSEFERAELLAMLNSRTVSARAATRARIVLWRSDGCLKKEVAARAGVSRPTVDAALKRFAIDGAAGLLDKPVEILRPERVSAQVRARILALTRSSPPAETGLSHWSSRELSAFLKRAEGVAVSHNYIAALWRAHGLKPWRVGTFKLSRDPAFAEKGGRRRGALPGAASRRRARRESRWPAPRAGPASGLPQRRWATSSESGAVATAMHVSAAP